MPVPLHNRGDIPVLLETESFTIDIRQRIASIATHEANAFHSIRGKELRSLTAHILHIRIGQEQFDANLAEAGEKVRDASGRASSADRSE